MQSYPVSVVTSAGRRLPCLVPPPGEQVRVSMPRGFRVGTATVYMRGQQLKELQRDTEPFRLAVGGCDMQGWLLDLAELVSPKSTTPHRQWPAQPAATPVDSATYRVYLRDIRHVLSVGSALDDVYGRLRDPYGTGYLTGASTATWATLWTALWTLLPSVAGTEPTLPRTSAQPPEFRFTGGSAWAAIATVLGALRCSIVWDYYAGQFAVVELGGADDPYLDPSDPCTEEFGVQQSQPVPASVDIRYAPHIPLGAPTVTTTDYSRIDSYALSGDAGVLPYQDFLPCCRDASLAISNAANLTARTSELGGWLRTELASVYTERVYAAPQRTICGGLVRMVRILSDASNGTRTHIVTGSDLSVDVADGSIAAGELAAAGNSYTDNSITIIGGGGGSGGAGCCPSYRPHCDCYNSGQHNATTTATTIPYNSGSFVDTGDWSLSAGILTVKRAGWYDVGHTICYHLNSVGGGGYGVSAWIERYDSSTTSWVAVLHSSTDNTPYGGPSTTETRSRSLHIQAAKNEQFRCRCITPTGVAVLLAPSGSAQYAGCNWCWHSI